MRTAGKALETQVQRPANAKPFVPRPPPRINASLDVTELDLANLATVHRFAEALRSRLDVLDLLVNNAGIGSAVLRRTVDGFELVFGTNHLGHFAFTGLLLQTMIASPKPRVVTVTSMAHAMGHIDFDNLDASKGYREACAYFQSKLANVLFAYELQRRLSAAGPAMLSVACHSGWAATNMGADDHQRPLDRLLSLLKGDLRQRRRRAHGQSYLLQRHPM